MRPALRADRAPSAGLYDQLLVVMLARPMVTFLLVLGSLETA